MSLVGGNMDVILLVRAKDTADLRHVIFERLQPLPAVVDTQTYIIFDDHASGQTLPPEPSDDPTRGAARRVVRGLGREGLPGGVVVEDNVGLRVHHGRQGLEALEDDVPQVRGVLRPDQEDDVHVPAHEGHVPHLGDCLLYTSPSPRD